MVLLYKEDMIKFIELFKHGNIELNGRYLKFVDIDDFDIFGSIFKFYILRNQGMNISINESSDNIEVTMNDMIKRKVIRLDISDVDDKRILAYKFAKLSEAITYTIDGVKLTLSEYAYECLNEFYEKIEIIDSIKDADDDTKKLLYDIVINELRNNSLFNDSADNVPFRALNRSG